MSSIDVNTLFPFTSWSQVLAKAQRVGVDPNNLYVDPSNGFVYGTDPALQPGSQSVILGIYNGPTPTSSGTGLPGPVNLSGTDYLMLLALAAAIAFMFDMPWVMVLAVALAALGYLGSPLIADLQRLPGGLGSNGWLFIVIIALVAFMLLRRL